MRITVFWITNRPVTRSTNGGVGDLLHELDDLGTDRTFMITVFAHQIIFIARPSTFRAQNCHAYTVRR